MAAPTWDQADTSHCSFLCLWQRLSRQTSWVRGLGSEPQTASGSSCALAEGLVLLQATDLFLHPFPQVREHCPGRQGAATSKESIRPSPGGPTAGPARLGENPALQSLGGGGSTGCPPPQPCPTYLCPGPGAPGGRAALRVAGLSAGGHGLRTQAGCHPLRHIVGPSCALDGPALSAPTTRPAAGAPVPHRPTGRRQRHLGEGRHLSWRHSGANPTNRPQVHGYFSSFSKPVRSCGFSPP